MSTLLLRGHIQTFYVKHQGRRLGPYYARVWKQNGRRRRQYVPAHMLEETIAACQGYRERRKRQTEKRAELERILGNLSFLTRACRRAKRIEHLLPFEQEHVRRIQAEGIAAHGRPSMRRVRRFLRPLRKPVIHAPPQEAVRETATSSESPPPRRFVRSWTLHRPLPAWFTEELWDEMAARIPRG